MNSEYRKSGHRTSFMGRTPKSELFKEAVESISRLVESEGLEIADRAIAEALAMPRSEAFAKEHGVKLSSSTPCLRRVLGGRHGGKGCDYPFKECRAPGDDHVTLWLKEGTPWAYVSEPYFLTTETIGEMYKVSQDLGLSVTISTDSSYFPGQSLHVLYKNRDAIG